MQAFYNNTFPGKQIVKIPLGGVAINLLNDASTILLPKRDSLCILFKRSTAVQKDASEAAIFRVSMTIVFKDMHAYPLLTSDIHVPW